MDSNRRLVLTGLAGLVATGKLPSSVLADDNIPEPITSETPVTDEKLVQRAYEILANSTKADTSLDWLHLINKIYFSGDYELTPGEKANGTTNETFALDQFVFMYGRELDTPSGKIPYISDQEVARYNPDEQKLTSQFTTMIVSSGISPDRKVTIGGNQYRIRDFIKYVKANVSSHLGHGVQYKEFQLYALSLLLDDPSDPWKDSSGIEVTLNDVALSVAEGIIKSTHSFDELFYFFDKRGSPDSIKTYTQGFTKGVAEKHKTAMKAANRGVPTAYFTAIFLLGHATETFSIAAKLLGKYREKLDEKSTKAMINISNTLSKIVVDYRSLVGRDIILGPPANLTPHELGRAAKGLRSLSNLGYLGNLNLR